MTAHSKTGASSMERWSACPGSIRQCDGLPSTSTSYAQDGTNAHELARRCLTEPRDPTTYVDRRIAGDDGVLFEVTGEMAEAVQVYVDHLNNTFERGDVDQVEVRFDLSEVHPGCFGTADHVRWRAKDKLLIVTDYKHGAGVPVSPVENPQLMYYGLGALLASSYPASRVRLVIVQPRCAIDGETIREWELDALDLIDFKTDLKKYALATEDPNAPLVPGDHCRFCPAAAVCPALLERAQMAARQEFGASIAQTGGVDLPAPQPYDPAKLKVALDLRETLRGWLSALDEFAYAEALAGRCPIGYKLVDKRAVRKWRDEAAVAKHLWEHGDDIFEPKKLKSPAQMEAAKIIKKGELDERVIAGPDIGGVRVGFAMKESSGFALVPEDDKRPAVKILTAQQEFTAVTDQTQGIEGSGKPPVFTGQISASGEEIPDFLKRKKG